MSLAHLLPDLATAVATMIATVGACTVLGVAQRHPRRLGWRLLPLGVGLLLLGYLATFAHVPALATGLLAAALCVPAHAWPGLVALDRQLQAEAEYVPPAFVRREQDGADPSAPRPTPPSPEALLEQRLAIDAQFLRCIATQAVLLECENPSGFAEALAVARAEHLVSHPAGEA